VWKPRLTPSRWPRAGPVPATPLIITTSEAPEGTSSQPDAGGRPSSLEGGEFRGCEAGSERPRNHLK